LLTIGTEEPYFYKKGKIIISIDYSMLYNMLRLQMLTSNKKIIVFRLTATTALVLIGKSLLLQRNPLMKWNRKKHLMASFTYFGNGGSGYITVDKVQKACVECDMEENINLHS
jgi:hypothetical protein